MLENRAPSANSRGPRPNSASPRLCGKRASFACALPRCVPAPSRLSTAIPFPGHGSIPMAAAVVRISMNKTLLLPATKNLPGVAAPVDEIPAPRDALSPLPADAEPRLVRVANSRTAGGGSMTRGSPTVSTLWIGQDTRTSVDRETRAALSNGIENLSALRTARRIRMAIPSPEHEHGIKTGYLHLDQDGRHPKNRSGKPKREVRRRGRNGAPARTRT